MRTRIKLCGFQTEDTVRAATRAGADAVGFVFYPPSPRHVEVQQAAVGGAERVGLRVKDGGEQGRVAVVQSVEVAFHGGGNGGRFRCKFRRCTHV